MASLFSVLGIYFLPPLTKAHQNLDQKWNFSYDVYSVTWKNKKIVSCLAGKTLSGRPFLSQVASLLEGKKQYVVGLCYRKSYCKPIFFPCNGRPFNSNSEFTYLVIQTCFYTTSCSLNLVGLLETCQ